MMDTKINLSECSWQLKGFYPWVPLKDKSMETGKELQGITDWLSAQVPGGVHKSLYDAGLIAHPYTDLNSLQCEWVEHRWWLYKTLVPVANLAGERQTLVFEGLDYKAMIYLDGRLVATHEGMYHPLRIDITELCRDGDKETLELRVLLQSVPDEMGQIGKTSETYTQKSRFGYKWDFGTRLVNLGIWGDCYIECAQAAVLRDVCMTSDYAQDTGYLSVSARVDGEIGTAMTAECTLMLGDWEKSWRLPVIGGKIAGSAEVEKPALWHPAGMGEQPLYHCALRLLDQDGAVLDEYTQRLGIRSLRVLQNEDAPDGALPYTFCVNGRRMYVRGVNMTPLDHAYGDVSAEHYRQMVALARRMNVNMIRVWGGGLIEKEVFYDLCDAAGILVWQEFVQSSSGINNIPSQKPEFLNLLRKSAEAAVLAKRGHTCLAVWSGGNELTDSEGVPAGYADANIAMLKEIVERLDPGRIFLPTSASGPREFISFDKNVSHDIHGHWNYEGNPFHYELYGQSDNLFHSEFGCEGMVSPESLDRFISKALQTVTPAEQHMAYRHHGEWWCTVRRDEALFGALANVQQLSACSQWIQAEGLRYILECNRRRKFHNSGSIIWQINEPWPNVFCTSLVDYYSTPKMAYYWAQNAFAALAPSLAYNRLDYQCGAQFEADVYLSLDDVQHAQDYRLTCEVVRTNGELLHSCEWSGTLDVHSTARLGTVSFALPAESGMFLVRMRATAGELIGENSYFFSCGEAPVYREALGLTGDVHAELCAQGDGWQQYRVRCVGATAALHVQPHCDNGYTIVADSACFVLLPDESRVVTVHYSQPFNSGFIESDPVSDPPDIRFSAFGSN